VNHERSFRRKGSSAKLQVLRDFTWVAGVETAWRGGAGMFDPAAPVRTASSGEGSERGGWTLECRYRLVRGMARTNSVDLSYARILSSQQSEKVS
jgi:hypothetical protein